MHQIHASLLYYLSFVKASNHISSQSSALFYSLWWEVSQPWHESGNLGHFYSPASSSTVAHLWALWWNPMIRGCDCRTMMQPLPASSPNNVGTAHPKVAQIGFQDFFHKSPASRVSIRALTISITFVPGTKNPKVNWLLYQPSISTYRLLLWLSKTFFFYISGCQGFRFEPGSLCARVSWQSRENRGSRSWTSPDRRHVSQSTIFSSLISRNSGTATLRITILDIS